jgi:CsoR family transcriptional regulator, copper-sensing transcriptional repressor
MTKANPGLLARLSRIEGQLGGIRRMVENERYCIDILTQIQAVKAAIKRVEEEVLKEHAATCVADAIKSGNAKNQQKKFSELVALISRYGR